MDADDSGDEAEHPGLPDWVKVLGVVLVVFAIFLVTALLMTGGDHGPGRHM